ncbi:protein of unknown function [Kyrpidia spormannii]|uniref:Uncharacterized protein n=2 Tax=Kyrpidia spormannii TaxID=2055160 RepID=A0ACA8Z8A5_9BACL|nr:protein of unknown function [Kyrpidia spormannii]CAB3392525.1 protein of unknown function [Kyrpidia spormannii]
MVIGRPFDRTRQLTPEAAERREGSEPFRMVGAGGIVVVRHAVGGNRGVRSLPVSRFLGQI